MERSYIETLKKALEARMRQGALPPKLELPEEGEALVRIIDIVESPWKAGTKIYVVVNLEDGIQYRLPVSVVLNRMIADFNAKVGDYLLIKYRGMKEYESGKKVSLWNVGHLSAEEASKMIPSPLMQETESKVKTVMETPKDVKFNRDEAVKFIDSLIGVYGFITVRDLDHYFNKVKGWNVKIDEEFVKSLGFKLSGDKIVK
jgi:hypothetical protein